MIGLLTSTNGARPSWLTGIAKKRRKLGTTAEWLAGCCSAEQPALSEDERGIMLRSFSPFVR